MEQQEKRFSYKKKQGLWEIYDSWQNDKCVKKVKAITSSWDHNLTTSTPVEYKNSMLV